MTVQQAIEKHIEECRHRIDNIQSFMESNTDADIAECEDNMESLRMAAVALGVIRDLQDRNMTLEVLENYMQFEDECVKKGFTFKSVLEAREKQIAKKPKKMFGRYDGICECGKHVFDCDKFCYQCGQKLDWSNNNDL